MGKDLTKDEINSGLLNSQTYRKYSKDLLITNSVTDSLGSRSAIIRTAKGITQISPTIGYVVKNIGKEPIAIDRITVYPISKVPTVLNPGQSIALSRAEVAVLCAKPEVCCVLKNARLLSDHKKCIPNIYEYLYLHYIKLTDKSIDMYADNFRLDVWKVVKPDEIFKYFPVKGFGNKKQAQ